MKQNRDRLCLYCQEKTKQKVYLNTVFCNQCGTFNGITIEQSSKALSKLKLGLVIVALFIFGLCLIVGFLYFTAITIHKFVEIFWYSHSLALVLILGAVWFFLSFRIAYKRSIEAQATLIYDQLQTKSPVKS